LIKILARSYPPLFVGGSGSIEDVEEVISVDENNNVYVSGYTKATDFPMAGTPYDSVNDSENEIFIIKMNSTLDTLLAFTFLSATISSKVYALIVEDTGDVLVAGEADNGFDTTLGAYQENIDGAYDGILSRLDGSLST
jgi:hypothetical protein